MDFAELFTKNIPATVAVLGLCVYFLGMAIAFISAPLKFCEKFSIKPVDNAGITEIRVYYGGISFALAAFLALLFVNGLATFALAGGLLFANTVFFIRLIFTFVDKGWKAPYTKLAIPCEGLFVIALWICFILAKVLY